MDFAYLCATCSEADTQSRVDGIVIEDLPEDGPRVRCPDITRARKHRGWEPEVEIDRGLQITLIQVRLIG